MIIQFSLQCGRFIAGIACHDTVNQRRAEAVGVVEPLNKGGRQRPLLRIAQDEFAQCVTVVVNQLAGNDDPALVSRTVEVAKALKQQTRQLRRIAHRRGIVDAVTRVVADTRFGGVREYKPHIGIVSQFQKCAIVVIDADFPVNGADQPGLAHRLALLIQATNDRGVQPILGA